MPCSVMVSGLVLMFLYASSVVECRLFLESRVCFVCVVGVTDTVFLV